MREALKHFVLVVFAVGFLAGIGWLILSQNGFSKHDPQPYPHRFLDALIEKKRVIAYRGLSSEFPPNSKLAFEKAAALSPDLILWVDARPTADGTWMAWSDRTLNISTDGSTWMAYTKDADIAKLDAAYKTSFDGGKTFPFRGQGFRIEKLETILTSFPNHFFVVNLFDYQEGGKEQIIKLLQETKAGERALIASPEDGILRDLREAQPTWLFGTSRAQVTRLVMLSRLFLTAAAPVRGDVFVWDPTEPASKLSEAAWNEVNRRKMKTIVAVDDPSNRDENPVWLESANAVVTSRPALWLKP